MLTSTDIQAINNLSEPCKAVLSYALKPFITDIEAIKDYCNMVDNNEQMQAFHNNLLSHAHAMKQAIDLLKFEDKPLSLIEHFAPKHN